MDECKIVIVQSPYTHETHEKHETQISKYIVAIYYYYTFVVVTLALLLGSNCVTWVEILGYCNKREDSYWPLNH